MTTISTQIAKNEKIFSANNYDGNMGENYKIIRGNIPIMLSAPHSVNHYRNGQKKWADLWTGGIALYLQQITGCHLIYNACFAEKDPNFDASDNNDYQKVLKQYLKNKSIYVLLDLHGSSASREYAVELGTAPSPDKSEQEKQEDLTSLHGIKIIEDVVMSAFNQNFAKLETTKKSVWKNKIFSAGGQNTVTKGISDNTNTSCLQLEINAEYRNPDNQAQFTALITALQQIIQKLSILDWSEIIKEK